MAGVLAMILLYRQVRQRQTRTAICAASRRASATSSSRRWTRSSPSTSSQRIVAVQRRGRARVPLAAQRGARAAARRCSSPSGSAQRHRAHIERFGDTGRDVAPHGRPDRADGAARQRRGIPDRGVDLAARRGRPKLFTVILRDVTERLRAEELLARSEARLRGILDSAMDAIITVDEQPAHRAVQCGGRGDVRLPARARRSARRWPGSSRSASAPPRRHCGASARPASASRRMGAQRIVTGLRRNGEEFPIDASISQVSEQRAQVLHGDPARRDRARAGGGRAAALEGGTARARRAARCRARTGKEPHRARAARRAGPGADRAARWTSPGASSSRRRSAGRSSAKLDTHAALLDGDRRGHAAHRRRPAAADARRPGSVPAVDGWWRTSRSAPASPANWRIERPRHSSLPTAHATAVFRVRAGSADQRRQARAGNAGRSGDRADADGEVT